MLHALPFGLSWLTAARLMGAVYLAIAAMLVVVSMPMTLQQFSTVNNDSLGVVLALAAAIAVVALSLRHALVGFPIFIVRFLLATSPQWIG